MNRATLALLVLILATLVAMAGCTAGQIREALAETDAALGYAHVQVDSFAELVVDLEAELAGIPDNEPGKAETIILLGKAAEALDYWTQRRDALSAQMADLEARVADLADDEDATILLGQSAAEVAAMFGIPGAGIIAAILGGIAQRRKVSNQTGTAIALARAASPAFNAAFDEPQVSGVLKGSLPATVQEAGKAANWKVGVKHA